MFDHKDLWDVQPSTQPVNQPDRRLYIEPITTGVITEENGLVAYLNNRFPHLPRVPVDVRDGYQWPEPQPTTPTTPTTPTDPVMQAILQQLEYTKGAGTRASGGSSGVSRVAVLPSTPAQQGTGAVVLIVLVVLVIGGWFLLKKKAKPHGGVRHIENDD